MDTQTSSAHTAEVAAYRAGGSWLTRPRWSPYLVGALIGVLSWAVFAIVNKPIGMSTQVAATSGACLIPIVGEESVRGNAYYATKAKPALNYSMLFLIGTFIGAAVSALVSRSWRVETVPQFWQRRFGPSAGWRYLGAFVGGVLLLYGARMADGCTSGHGISGTLQLAVSSWTFFVVLFITGVLTAGLLFGIESPARTEGGRP